MTSIEESIPGDWIGLKVPPGREDSLETDDGTMVGNKVPMSCYRSIRGIFSKMARRVSVQRSLTSDVFTVTAYV